LSEYSTSHRSHITGYKPQATQNLLLMPGKHFGKDCTAKWNEDGVVAQGTIIPCRVNVCCMLSGLCDQIVYPGTDKRTGIILTFL